MISLLQLPLQIGRLTRPRVIASTSACFDAAILSCDASWACFGGRTIHTQPSPLLFRATNCLFAEPLKKKKKLDPGMLKLREERKAKRLEKEIRQLQKHARKPKPLDEMQPDIRIMNRLQERIRPKSELAFEEAERRALLQKDWSRYKGLQYARDVDRIQSLVASQENALKQLRLVSEDLYQAAIQIDERLLPFDFQGPTTTPPNEAYRSPDGDYIDTTRKWE